MSFKYLISRGGPTLWLSGRGLDLSLQDSRSRPGRCVGRRGISPRVPVVYVTGAAHAIAPHQQAEVEAIVEKPCGLTALLTVIRVLTVTTGDRPTAGPPLASA